MRKPGRSTIQGPCCRVAPVWHRFEQIPVTVEGEWLRCALHAHTTELRRRARAPRARQALRTRGLRRARDHRPLVAQRSAVDGRLLVLPSAELNCLLPGDRDGHVLGFGIGGCARRARRRVRATSRHGRVDHSARRRRLPRAPVLDRGHARLARAPRDRRRHRGLQRRLRARDRPGAVDRALGRAARRGPPVLRARHRRQPPSGLRLGPRLDVGARPERTAEAVLARPRGPAASTAARGPCCTMSRSAARSDRGALQPVLAPSPLVSGVSSGAAVNAGRLGYRYGGEILAATDDGWITARAARRARSARVRAHRGDRRARTAAWTNPLWP